MKTPGFLAEDSIKKPGIRKFPTTSIECEQGVCVPIVEWRQRTTGPECWILGYKCLEICYSRAPFQHGWRLYSRNWHEMRMPARPCSQ